MARYSEVRETVDGQTGEVLTTHRSYTTKSVAEPFVQFFHSHPDFQKVFAIARLRDQQVLWQLCVLSEYDTGRIKFGAGERKTVCTALGVSAANLSGSLTRLRRLGLVLGRAGQLQLNPRVFWKGTSKARTATIATIFPDELPNGE